MKKKLLFLVLLMVLSLGLAACENLPSFLPEGLLPIHTHSWESVWEYDYESHWHACQTGTCEEVDSKAVHTWDKGEVTKEPTDVEAGEKTYRCTVCGFAKTEVIDSLVHTHEKLEAWTTDETNHWKTCSGCNEKLDLGAHSGGSATCTTGAECEVCGETYGETLDHTEVIDAKVEPTCTEKGKTEGKHCSVCNEVLVAQEEIAALGHHFIDGKCVCGEQYVEEATGEWTVVTELKDGDNVLIGAPAYGKLLSTVKVASFYNKGVDYTAEDFTNVTDAEIFVVTVNEDETYTFTSVTGKVIAVSASYASLDETSSHKSWTLIEKGDGLFYLQNSTRSNYLEWYASKNNWSTFNPSSLSDLFELSFYAKAAATGEGHVHNYISDVHNVTCTEDGYATYTCACGDSYREEGEKAIGHQYSSEVTAPTCTEAGYTTYTCECGDSYKEAGEAATGHTYEDGKCAACGAVDPEAHVHSYKPVVVAPTCTSEGYTSYECECGDSYVDEDSKTAKLSHVDKNEDVLCDYECGNKVVPVTGSSISLTHAINLVKSNMSLYDKKYYLEGTITEVKDATNGGIYITDGTETFFIRITKNADGSIGYKSLEEKFIAGDKIRVYGKIEKSTASPYNPQMAEGWVVILEQHDHEYGEPTCTEKAECRCGKTTGEPLGHLDENSDKICDRCNFNTALSIEQIVVRTDNNSGVLDETAGTYTWSGTDFEVVVAKGTSSQLYKTAKDHMRVYNGNKISIINKNGLKIASIKVTLTNATQVTNFEKMLTGYTFTKDEADFTITIELDTIESIVFNPVSTTQIKAIEVYYE